MNPDQIIEKMEALAEELKILREEHKKAEDGAKSAIKSIIDGKKSKYDELNDKLVEAEEQEKIENAKNRRNTNLDADKTNVPNVDVDNNSEHNQNNRNLDHGKALLKYATDEESGDHAKAVLARDHGDNFVNEFATKEGMRLTPNMANYIAPNARSISEIENACGKSAEEMFGKSVVLVREASGTNSGGASSVDVDFEPTLFKTPKRLNDIASKCWVKRAVGRQAQWPKLTQSTNQFGVAATWGNAGASNGEGASITQSDPVQTQITVDLERLALLTATSKRYMRNNDINFLSELAWMFRGTCQYKLGNAILEGVSGGPANAPQGINENVSIAAGVTVVSRQTASQVSYTDMVALQFAVDDGIFGTGEYFISSGSTGAMKYIMSLDDSSGRPVFAPEDTWGQSGPSTIRGAQWTNAKENTTALGGRGDVIYGNMLGYGLAVDGEDMAIERSDDYGFNTGQIYFRLIMYAGGQPIGYDMFSMLGDVSTASSSSSSS